MTNSLTSRLATRYCHFYAKPEEQQFESQEQDSDDEEKHT